MQWCGWMCGCELHLEGRSWPLWFTRTELSVCSRFRCLKKLNHETWSGSRLEMHSPHKFQQERWVITPFTLISIQKLCHNTLPWGFCMPKCLFPPCSFLLLLKFRLSQTSGWQVFAAQLFFSLAEENNLEYIKNIFFKVSDVIRYALLKAINLPLEFLF